MDDSPWSSLEVVKILIAFLTPLLLVGLGFVIDRASRRVEHARWVNEKLIEQRLEVYGRMAPDLNDLFCFVKLVGDFREVTPPKAVELKRKLDKDFHVNKFLFGKEFDGLYRGFVGLMFEEGGYVATDALIRLDPEDQQEEVGEELWETDWNERFSPLAKERRDRDTIASAYDAFMRCFAQELGVGPRDEAKAA